MITATSRARQRPFSGNKTDLLRAIMDSAAEGIAVLDGTGQCLLWNPACEKILGFHPGNVAHKDWPKHFGFYLPDKVTPFPVESLPFSRALHGESPDEVEIFVRNKVRREGLWISKKARPLGGGEGGAVATIRDITFTKNSAEEIARSNHELEQFAYVASHDLQEPLRMVASYVQLLSRRYKGQLDAEADEFIFYASDGAKRMQQLINDLLGYARIGQDQVKYKLLESGRVLEHVLHLMQEKISDSGAEVTHDPLPAIAANEVLLTQLFQNLIENAIKFKSHEPPRVHVSAHRSAGEWVFSVADNGVGIAPEYKDRVFVIFQRLHSRDAYPGTGIGLAICKKIVEQHGGTIWVEAPPSEESLKKGADIRFSWPNTILPQEGGPPDA